MSQSNFDFAGMTADDYIEMLQPLRLTSTEKAEITQAFNDFVCIINTDSDLNFAD
jgi:hypothetical protein